MATRKGKTEITTALDAVQPEWDKLVNDKYSNKVMASKSA